VWKYLRVCRVKYSWKPAQIALLETVDLKIERDLCLFYSVLTVLVVILTNILAYPNVFEMPLPLITLGYGFIVMRAKASLALMQQELHSRT
jgi:hypothetical protein